MVFIFVFWKLSPRMIKKIKNNPSSTTSSELSYTPPYDWNGILNFLEGRVLKGIEHVEDGRYYRTVQIDQCKGWICVSHVPTKNALNIEMSLSLVSVQQIILERIRNIFDLNAQPDIIAAHLSQDPFLAEDVKRNPGLRVPGAFDGFELAVRAILGQQVTVKAATTIAGRFVKAFGELIETPFSFLQNLCPTPDCISNLQIQDIASQGIIRTRAQSIIDLAKEISSKGLALDAHVDPEKTINQLIGIKGIGKWTAHYIAMRALRWPDAFPKEDVALLKRLGGVTPKQAEALSQAWRPWRTYALLHIWHK